MENDANKEMFFSKYLQISNEGLPNCIKNYRTRRYIFWTVLRGKKYYIKKYVCRGIFSLKIALGINTDKVKRNTEISSALERLDILHAKPVFNRTKVYTPLCRVSVIVTEDVGESFTVI